MVTVAVWLLFAVAALQLISVVLDLSQAGTIADATEAAYRGTGDEEARRTGVIIGTVAGAVIGAVLAIAYIVLAFFNNRGKNPARITTWVLAGLGVCCGTIGVIAGAASSSFNFGGSDDGPDPADVQRQVNDALPSWYNPIAITLGVLVLLALLAVIILLALPPANEFFRKPQQVWQPPAYPQAGGYPQPGGYPAPGSYYPPPAQPPAPGIPPAPPPPGGQPAPPPPGGQPPAGYEPPGGSTPTAPPAPGGPQGPANPPPPGPPSPPPPPPGPAGPPSPGGPPA